MAQSGFRRWVVVLTVVSAAIMELIDTSIVNVGLSQMAGNLGVTIEDISWVVTSYAIANVIVIPMTGFLQNYFGRKNYYIGSIILFTIASYLCGIAHDLWSLTLFRFVQGVGGGALLSTSQGIMYDSFPPKQRPIASALFGMGIVMGPTLGPTLGGFIIDNYHWSWMFFINVPFGIVAVFLTLNFVEKQPYEFSIDRRKIHIDQVGILLLAVGVGALQYVLERGDADDWFDSRPILILSLVAAIALPLFIWWELRIKSPVIDLRVLQNRNLAIGSILVFIIGYGLFTSVMLFPLFAQRILGFTATKTGNLLIPGGAIAILIFPLVGRSMANGVSPRLFVVLGYIAFTAFCFMMAGLNADATESAFVGALLIRGGGMALINAPLINQSISTLQPRELPMGIAFTNMVRQLGGAFGVAVTNTYISQRSAVHRGDLVSHLQPGDMLTTERINTMTQGLVARGMNAIDAATAAYRNLDLIIQKQALMVSYLDTFRLAGTFFIVTFPLLFLLQNKKMDPTAAKAAADAAH